LQTFYHWRILRIPARGLRAAAGIPSMVESAANRRRLSITGRITRSRAIHPIFPHSSVFRSLPFEVSLRSRRMFSVVQRSWVWFRF
jgi:hypothetical protein